MTTEATTRPRIRTERLHLRLSVQDLACLRTLADRRDRSLSECVREAIEFHLAHLAESGPVADRPLDLPDR